EECEVVHTSNKKISSSSRLFSVFGTTDAIAWFCKMHSGKPERSTRLAIAYAGRVSGMGRLRSIRIRSAIGSSGWIADLPRNHNERRGSADSGPSLDDSQPSQVDPKPSFPSININAGPCAKRSLSQRRRERIAAIGQALGAPPSITRRAA